MVLCHLQPHLIGHCRLVSFGKVDEAEFPHLLQQYYLRLFPYDLFYNWLAYTDFKVRPSSGVI